MSELTPRFDKPAETSCRWGLLPDGSLCNQPGHDHGPWPDQGAAGEIICGNCGIPLTNHGPTGASCGEWQATEDVTVLAEAWARRRRLMASSDVELAVEAFKAGYAAHAAEALHNPHVTEADG